MTETHDLSRAGIPRFSLYGEPPRAFDERFVHIEPIADRSRMHDWVIEPHVHEDLHQLLLLLDGHAEIEADEKHRLYRAPALLIVPAGFVHTFRFRAETHGYVISASDAFIRSLNAHHPVFGELFGEARGLQLSEGDVQRYELETTAKTFLREQSTGVASGALLVEARAQILLAQAAQVAISSANRARAQAAIPQARAESTVEEFRRLIELHFHENWPLKRYADEMCISVAQLRCNCIKVTGSPPIKLLHERILREAKRSLRFTMRSVTEIAYELGFHDSAYFSRFFRARSGIAPTEFRRSLRSSRGREKAAARGVWQNSTI